MRFPCFIHPYRAGHLHGLPQPLTMTTPAFAPTPHPVLRLPTREQLLAMDPAERVELFRKREDLIRLEREDPLRHGFEPPTWREARALLVDNDTLGLFGGNREGKSRFAAKYSVQQLVERPGTQWGFFHSSEQSSINQQQPLVHLHLPPEWRNVGRVGTGVYVKWTKATGFSQQKFILPNGSGGYFWNYKQDVGVFEGYELDGVWFDELVPLQFIEAMAFRLGQGRRLVQLITFTPVRGYTATVGKLVVGARVVKSLPAMLLAPEQVHVRGCPPGHMPYVMAGRDPRTAALFFHLGSNPYGAAHEVEQKLIGAPLGKIKIRAYGWADKAVANAFPKYGPAHLVTRKRFEEIAAKGGTRYWVCDPGGTKNWFMKWYLVTPQGHAIVYREWPDHPTHGEWAVSPAEAQDESAGSRRWDFRPGPAQRSEAGRGMRDYKRLILTLEGAVWDERTKAWDTTKAEKIERRFMDPRFGGMEVPSEEEGTSIISLMADEQRDSSGSLAGPSMDIEPAPASRVDETVQMINERMDWDETAPLSAMNCPTWYVVDDLLQSRLAYEQFTAAGTERDALKDIIDPDRYFVKADAGHISAERWQMRGGFSY